MQKERCFSQHFKVKGRPQGGDLRSHLGSKGLPDGHNGIMLGTGRVALCTLFGLNRLEIRSRQVLKLLPQSADDIGQAVFPFGSDLILRQLIYMTWSGAPILSNSPLTFVRPYM